LKTGSASFSMADTLMLHQLITSSMVRIPEELWDTKTPEERVQQAIHYMNRNIDRSITNETLADVVGMAVNSFGRLFKEQTGLSPQHYLTRIRIENACNLLYHTNHNIDSIAEESGFSDRYYFSRVFKNQMNISPVRYRKQFQMM
ncbi:MAG TPA: AraC family transcriptional regulator, partial [Bacteroidales bacterium]|nr:AraC family transcriptional regulator [Bacteroidales bacterium]